MAQRNNLWANIDWWIVLLFVGLMLLGWINIYAALYNEEHKSIFDVTQRYGKQLIWIGAALIIGVIILLIDTNFYLFFSYPIYGLVALSLVLVLLVGVEINGSKSWFVIAGDLRLQPSEFAKFATAIGLARLMSEHNYKFYSVKSFALIALIIGLPVVLIMLQPDPGSAVVFFIFFIVLYREGMSGTVLFFGFLILILFMLAMLTQNSFLVGLLFIGSIVAYVIIHQRFRPAGIALLVGASITFILYAIQFLLDLDYPLEYILVAGTSLSMLGFMGYIVGKRIKRTLFIINIFFASVLFTYSVDYAFENLLKPHHQNRINELLGLQSDPRGSGWNVNQSKIAIGSGGFAGKGFLNGTQTKYNFVPEQSTDFIFCTVGEEWGFVGSTLVVAMFLILFWRLILLAERQRSAFSRIYGYGVVSVLFAHFAINIGMTIGLVPVIGIPLPFFSYGGSSLWAFTVLLFVFLRLDASRLDKLL